MSKCIRERCEDQGHQDYGMLLCCRHGAENGARATKHFESLRKGEPHLYEKSLTDTDRQALKLMSIGYHVNQMRELLNDERIGLFAWWSLLLVAKDGLDEAFDSLATLHEDCAEDGCAEQACGGGSRAGQFCERHITGGD